MLKTQNTIIFIFITFLTLDSLHYLQNAIQANINSNNTKNTNNINNKHNYLHPYIESIANTFWLCYLKTCDIVLILVSEYFITFRYCWSKILEALVILIYGYYNLLSILITTFLVWPNNIICCITACILLNIVRLILKEIL